MSMQALFDLMPVIIVGVGILIIMIQASWRRHPFAAQAISVVTLAIACYVQIRFFPAQTSLITELFEYSPVSSFFSLLIYLCCISVALLQGPYVRDPQKEAQEEFYILLLLAAMGGLLLVMARHMAGLLLGLELMSLAMLAILAYNRERKQALESALKYLILSGAATSLLLMGMALIYATTGSLMIEDTVSGNLSLLSKAGIVLLIAALAFKLSLVPLHIWTPDVYQGAPTNATLLLTTLSKTAVLAILMKILLSVSADFADALAKMLSWMAIASMLLGNWLALRQTNIKRLMAYSAIAHMGYVMVAGVVSIGVNNDLVIEGASYYLLAYLIASILIFAVITLLSDLFSDQDVDELDSVTGLFWRHPWYSVLLTFAFLSLAGMPITVGFIGKFYLLHLAIEQQAWWLLFAMIVGSAVGIYYYLRIVFALFSKQGKDYSVRTGHLTTKLWLTFVGVSLILFGLLPGLVGDNLSRLLAGS